MYYIGADLGTSAVKLLLMNSEGEIVNTVSREYPLYFPKNGWSEQNPEDWYKQTVDGIRELVAGVNREEVAGLSFGGQMHGMVLLDKEDRVIRPAILWNDGRTEEETRFLNEEIGKDKLAAWTANIAFAGFTAPKLLWVRKNEPENFKKIAKIMLPKDYLAYRFTGVFSTDYSDASGLLLLDVANKKWSPEMLEICGITEDVLPKLFESYEPIGCLTSEAAGDMGLTVKTIVAAGAGDNAASAVGTGTVGNGRCNISMGTSGTIFISSEEFKLPENNTIHSFCHADGHYHLMGVVLSAASTNKWWNEEILNTKDFAKEQAGITKLGENPVFFLPYLMGERTPHNDTRIRSLFYGMSMDTKREDMTQAVFEGVAFAFRDSVEIVRGLGIELTESKICGGGAKSPLWIRIMANVLNLNLYVLKNEQGPSLGGACLAAVAAGEYKTVEEISSKVFEIREVVRPEPELVAKYNEKYGFYRKLYPALREIL